MASHAAPAVCSTPAFQDFLPLAGFPPAQGWCSTVSLLPTRSRQDEANALTLQDVPCPVGSDLCALLADLKAADYEFARGVCCCVGVCIGNEPTQAVITVPGTTTPTSSSTSTTSQTSSSSMTYIQRHSSTSLRPASSSTSSSSSSSSLTYIQRHSSDSLKPMSSVSTSSSVSSTSALMFPRSASGSPSSTLSLTSTSSSSSSSSTSTTCEVVVGGDFGRRPVLYGKYYSGTGYVENTNNPGNGGSAPVYSSLPGTLTMCAAAQACASSAAAQAHGHYAQFDLHYVNSNATWECVQFFRGNADPMYFDVVDAAVGAAYGYSMEMAERSHTVVIVA